MDAPPAEKRPASPGDEAAPKKPKLEPEAVPATATRNRAATAKARAERDKTPAPPQSYLKFPAENPREKWSCAWCGSDGSDQLRTARRPVRSSVRTRNSPKRR